jgi:hypothetical protein
VFDRLASGPALVPVFTRIGTRKIAYDMRDVKAWVDIQKQCASSGAKAAA